MTNHLKDMQSWMYQVITHTESAEQGADNTQIHDDKWEIEKIVAPSKTLNSQQRVNIYRDSYFIRLIECLHNEFNGLLNALGNEMFDHFAWNYLQAYPSSSYTLNELGKMFPEYLQQSLEESLNGQEPDDWQLFIIDMARYERTFVEVFNGDGHEELVPNEFFSELGLNPSPSIQMLQLNFPIAECISKFRKNETNSFPDKELTTYVFSRNKYRVGVHSIMKKEQNALLNWMQNPQENCPVAYQTSWKLNGICYQG